MSIRRRRTSELFDLDAVLTVIRSGTLATDDTRKIVDALQNQQLIDSAQIADDASETLLSYLTRFWDYDKSKYLREKKAFGQSIGKRHCYEQTRHLKR